MKTLIAALALAAFIATPFATPAVADETEVIVGGKVIGKDPDANVRLQLRRDYGSEGY